MRTPNTPLEESIKNHKVVMEMPYTLSVEELNVQTLAEFEVIKADYGTILIDSQAEFDERLASHDDEVAKAEARYNKKM